LQRGMKVGGSETGTPFPARRGSGVGCLKHRLPRLPRHFVSFD
jgi:hypothetical protein